MNRSKLKQLIQILFLATLIICAGQNLNAQTGTYSSEKLTSDTELTQIQIDNASKAFDELALMDKLIESKEREISLLKERLILEQEKSKLALEIADARKSQAEALSRANESLLIAISAKDLQIQNLEKEVEMLKKKKPSLVKRILDIAAGIGIGILLK